MDNAQMKKTLEKTRAELAECLEDLELFRLLAHNIQVGTFLQQDGKFLYINDQMALYAGYSRNDLLGRDFLEFVHPDDREMVVSRAIARCRGEDVPNCYDFRVVHRDGSTVWVRLLAAAVTYRGRPAVVGNFVDITGRVREMQKLEEATSSLSEKLTEKEMELAKRAQELTAVNKALQQIAAQSRSDVVHFKNRVMGNVEELVMPLIGRMKEGPLTDDQMVSINVLESNLTQIMDSFVARMGTRERNLSPREMEVANLVRQGHSSKEIASILQTTRRAVEFHRDNIRKKLGIKKSRKNLRSFLTAN
ncbi:MAG: PAS domain S-box protein [Deltaproteobacteria bacterium]|nr:PAS domain S-box protein [Deltaproteobacteria bacterium]